MYAFLNVFFFVFHTVLVLFNGLGWIWKKTRKANLITLLLTGGSWTVLAPWYGFGYCPSTDWHWQARRELGYHDMPHSYMKFLVDSLTGLDVNAQVVDVGTLVFFLVALVASSYLNYRDWRRGRA